MRYDIDVMYQFMLEDVQGPMHHIKRSRSKEFEWLFIFAGWLKGLYRDGEIPEIELECWMRVFSETVCKELTPGKDRMDWEDLEAVRLAFDKAWKQRRFALDTVNLERAIKSISIAPLDLPKGMNTWVAKVINLAHCLQKHQPDLPFLLPVSETVAEQLGTSLRTLSLALGQAIELGYVEVVEEATKKHGRRRARRLRFNYERLDCARLS